MSTFIKIVSFVLAVVVSVLCIVACGEAITDTDSSSVDSVEPSSDGGVSQTASEEISYDSEEPSSEEPSNEEASSEEPSSEEPSSEEPSSEEPSIEEPSSEEPVSSEEPSEEPTEEPVSRPPAVDRIDPSKIEIKADDIDSYFDDGVFVGNSIMLGYSKYTNKLRAGNIPSFLGGLKFFCGGSFGIYNNQYTISDKTFHPTYQGVKYKVEDAVGAMGAKKVYLNLMGLNDLAMYGNPSKCSELCTNDVIWLIEEIERRYEGVEVAVLSATYLTKSRNNMPSLNNENLSKMNQLLLEYCNANGHDFIDIATPLLDDNGCLNDNYSSDGYCHINTSGYKIWTVTLRKYAEQKTAGTYENPEYMQQLSKN